MSYLLYYSPDSANLVVRMILEELAADYSDREVPRKRSDREADFLRLNPRGLLPVLVDEAHDCVLFETGAIALYLADRHGALAPGPSEAKARAECLKWLFMLSNTLHADLNVRFYPERYVSRAEEMAALKAAIDRRIRGHLAVLDEALGVLGGDDFLPWGLSVCDFYLGCCLRWAQIYPVGEPPISAGDLKPYGRLTQLLSRLGQRPSVQRALVREGISGGAFIDPIARLPARKPDAIGSVMP